MDDILNSHDSPADVMTKYHQALTKYLLFDKKVGQHETIKRTSPPMESVVHKTPDESPVESPVEQTVKLGAIQVLRNARGVGGGVTQRYVALQRGGGGGGGEGVVGISVT